MYLQRKIQRCIFILSVLFRSETETRFIFCTRRTSLGAKSGLSDEFSKFRQKIKTTFLGHESFLLFKLKLRYFVQESAAKFTIFYLL
jgi:hypothetical protein